MRPSTLLLLLLALPALASTPKRAVECYGTSLTYGLAIDPTPYPARLATATGRPVDNYGFGGDRMAYIYNRWLKYGLKEDGTSWPYYAIIVEGCTNDLAFDGTTGADCWATAKTFLDAAHSKGLKVIFIPPTPRYGSSNWDDTKESERLAIITAATSYATTATWLTVMGVDALLGEPCAAPNQAHTCLRASYEATNNDHLHFGGAGMQALAEDLANHL